MVQAEQQLGVRRNANEQSNQGSAWEWAILMKQDGENSRLMEACYDTGQRGMGMTIRMLIADAPEGLVCETRP